MNVTVKPTDAVKFEGDMLVVAAFIGKSEDGFVLSREAALVDRRADGQLAKLLGEEQFEATPGATFLWHPHEDGFGRLLVVGFGKVPNLNIAKLEAAIVAVARRARATGAKKVGIALPEELYTHFGSEKAAEAVVTGFAMGTYVFLKHKSKAKKEEKSVSELVILAPPGRISAVSGGATVGVAIGKAVSYARDLVNEAPSVTTPTYLGDEAKALAKKDPRIRAEVLGREEIAKLGMGGLLAIARGSSQEPKFIKLTYRGGGRKTIALVGKGITFDTGGLSLKPSEHMETMKLDMAGAASILAVFLGLTALAPKATVVGLISATENMPGPNAVKPGDVATIMNGKSVEILNTDAEGRMVLADALSYAQMKVKPDVTVDLATLTGACMVALGQDVAGLFANDERLAQSLMDAAGRSGELVWRMPLVFEYRELLKSPVADLKNISGGRYGGAITAALFLEEFVGEGTSWAHLDIAGPAWAEKDMSVSPKGGTGFGVRMILEYLRSFS
jgi:leucyl aminopeptidase